MTQIKRKRTILVYLFKNALAIMNIAKLPNVGISQGKLRMVDGLIWHVPILTLSTRQLCLPKIYFRKRSNSNMKTIKKYNFKGFDLNGIEPKIVATSFRPLDNEITATIEFRNTNTGEVVETKNITVTLSEEETLEAIGLTESIFEREWDFEKGTPREVSK